MKSLSVKLDNKILEEAEAIAKLLKLTRDRYFNEAIGMFNQFNKKQLLKKKLAKESILTMEDSKQVLKEFEMLNG